MEIQRVKLKNQKKNLKMQKKMGIFYIYNSGVIPGGGNQSSLIKKVAELTEEKE